MIPAPPPDGPPASGAVGHCELCGKWVRPRNLYAEWTHNATVVYGSNRVICGGRIAPIGGVA